MGLGSEVTWLHGYDVASEQGAWGMELDRKIKGQKYPGEVIAREIF